MPIYHDGKKMKPYRGYRKPVNVYYGDKKVAGWKNSTQTGNNLTFQTTYNDAADVVVKGKTLQKSEWVHKQGLTTQQTWTGKNKLDTVRTELGAFDQSTGAEIAGVSIQVRTTYAITVLQGQSIVYSCDTTQNTRIFVFGLVGEYLGTYAMSPNASYTASVDCLIYIVSSAAGFPPANKYQYEIGSAATPYEPYVGGIASPNPAYPQPLISNLPAGTYKTQDWKGDWWEFTLNADLCGIGEVRDVVEFDKYGHNGFLRVETGVKAFNGTENWNTSNNCFYYVIASSPVKFNSIMGFCTHYKQGTISGLWNNTIDMAFVLGSGYFGSATSSHTAIRDSRFSNATAFKAELAAQYAAGTPVTVVYQLATPTRTPLTFTKNNSSTAPECPMEFLTDTPSLEYPAEVFDASGTVKVANADNTQSQTATTEILRSNADGTVYDEFEVKTGKVTRKIGRIESYNGEEVGDDWISSTGALDTGATVIYELAEPIEEQHTPVTLPTHYPTTVITTTNDTPAELTTTATVKVEDA